MIFLSDYCDENCPILRSYLDSIQLFLGRSSKKSEMQQETNSSKLHKILILEDEDTERVHVAPLLLDPNAHALHLTPLLQTLIGTLNDRLLRVYDFARQGYQPVAGDDCWIGEESMGEAGVVMVKVRRAERESVCSTSSMGSIQRSEIGSHSSSVRRERSKERVIFEVIEIVKKWRELHLSKNTARKLSLQDAAKQVGLPKKSLDDYYYQLRLGEKYDFDFHAHMFDRIGVLRTFLKDLKQNSKLDRTEKHPKRLKIIDDFDQLAQAYSAQRRMMLIDDYPIEQEPMKIEDEGQEVGGERVEDEVSLQDHFYNEFEYMLNDKDPFLSCDFNFKKKPLDDNSSEELFF